MRWSILMVGLLGIWLGGCQETRYVHVGQNWVSLQKLKPPEQSFAVEAGGKDRFEVGDDLRYTVVSRRSGQLWVIQVDPNDEVTLLYPNDHVARNDIDADRPVEIPPRGADWSIEAGKPLGTSIVAFIVTTDDPGLENVLGRADDLGKALQRVKDSPDWGMTTKTIEVVEKAR